MTSDFQIHLELSRSWHQLWELARQLVPGFHSNETIAINDQLVALRPKLGSANFNNVFERTAMAKAQVFLVIRVAKALALLSQGNFEGSAGQLDKALCCCAKALG